MFAGLYWYCYVVLESYKFSAFLLFSFKWLRFQARLHILHEQDQATTNNYLGMMELYEFFIHSELNPGSTLYWPREELVDEVRVSSLNTEGNGIMNYSKQLSMCCRLLSGCQIQQVTQVVRVMPSNHWVFPLCSSKYCFFENKLHHIMEELPM